MPRRKFDKKTATTFQLLHRAQNDPLIHDENASPVVFAEKQSKRNRNQDEDERPISSAASAFSSTSSRAGRVRHRGDLEEEFGFKVRANEGEAAEHGIFYDDSKYDYMQHMRQLGEGGLGDVTWIEAAPSKTSKGKQKLEDALRDLDLRSDTGSQFADAQSIGQSSMTSSVARSLLPEDMLPSEFVRKTTYQDQQDIPDDIAGFQPDMDPRLREVLEALDDEAYVEDEENIFEQLVGDGAEVDKDEWDRLGEQQLFEEDDEGWESDDTVRATEPAQPPPALEPGKEADPPADVHAQPPADPTAGAWIDEFKKFKSGKKGTPSQAPSGLDASALSSLASTRHKKRKGAKTSTTNYSMSSSALVRTDQQTLLDARFDKIEEEYANDEFGDDGQFDDAMSAASGMTGASKASRISRYSQASGVSRVSGISSYSRATDSEAPELARADFDSIMDDFLGKHSTTGRAGKRIRKGAPQTGMEQLDEVRSDLGPARIQRKTAKAG